MQRRSHDRIKTRLEAKFYCGSKENSGVITNISESGLFISTKIDFPVNISFDLLLPLNDGIMSIPVEISRLARSNGVCRGVGVAVVDPPLNYLEYVRNLRESLNLPG